MTRSIGTDGITGLVLAGGRGARMGGIDKGLQDFHGRPLALNAIERLQPQVGCIAINANRNSTAYAAFGLPVWPDSLADYPGPLAGFLTGLQRCETAWLLTVPCDTPHFPLDLVARLAEAAAAQGADIAMASAPELQDDGTVRRRAQPVFCLLRANLLDSLVRFTHDGGRKVADWVALHRHVTVPFDDANAFANANTLAELHALETQETTPCPSNSGSPSSLPPRSS